MNNELWRLEEGWLAGYTEDAELIRSIRRYKEPKGWRIMATYSSGAMQYKIPAEQRRSAERLFAVSIQ
ncbi:hypothetical protein [Planococcus halocryophilus]|uniref:hypothetical protein n=1 Tax=Planococcus halocryophilus TaxID=1215089 RepID=UPI001F0F31B5|nr:hypothetical protein [Planococcus halocryophilus]MCH4828079.1 hypothetical protein [Planococcus halocryophilus]